MAAALGLPPKRRWRFRFTIGALLACTLIVSVGLARWRLPDATLLAAGLASLNAWLLVGLAKALEEARRKSRQFGQLPREAKWSVGLDIGFLVAGILVSLLYIGISLMPRQSAALTTVNEL